MNDYERLEEKMLSWRQEANEQCARAEYWRKKAQEQREPEVVSKLYFESHVTIEPVFDERRGFAAQIATKHKFRLADLLMKKRSEQTEERSDKDTFMTRTHVSLEVITEATKALVLELQKEGFKVWRYKIEDTVFDSKFEDNFGLLNT